MKKAANIGGSLNSVQPEVSRFVDLLDRAPREARELMIGILLERAASVRIGAARPEGMRQLTDKLTVALNAYLDDLKSREPQNLSAPFSTYPNGFPRY